MNKALQGKKLLILGAIRMVKTIIEEAKKMGIYTCVTDYLENSPAKKYADESFMMSVTDVDSLVDLCKRERFDGVTIQYIESMLPYYFDLCKQMDYPVYGTKEQFILTSNKKSFKEICKKNKVPTIKEYKKGEKVDFPIFVKPVDNSGARGMTICYSNEELSLAIRKAEEFSKAKDVLIEKYMDDSCACVNIDYLVVDGEFHLVGVGDKYVLREKENTAPITAAVSYPSIYLDEYVRDLDEKVKTMYSSLGIKNGYIFIESFHDEDGFHFYEMGYRIGGGQYYLFLDKLFGVNVMQMFINHALTGKMINKQLPNTLTPYLPKQCCSVVLLLSKGVIGNIFGLEKISDCVNIINFTQLLAVGDEIKDSDVGTLKQALCRLHIIAEDREDLKNIITNVFNTIQVLDVDGKDLLIDKKISLKEIFY